ncbi:unnamed protein product [Euphydryas editha]|uniref:Uncharacterized protein n=1 Tax=Euphydryas editha TaxID=104508 RepID=A0AAU9V7R2_EUPED|nr:unnamed protein product [Euphydryas editha]
MRALGKIGCARAFNVTNEAGGTGACTVDRIHRGRSHAKEPKPHDFKKINLSSPFEFEKARWSADHRSTSGEVTETSRKHRRPRPDGGGRCKAVRSPCFITRAWGTVKNAFTCHSS